jgi:lipopolysaccharide/colanic/teichoic acid biosynthesis glycosyltransferase
MYPIVKRLLDIMISATALLLLSPLLLILVLLIALDSPGSPLFLQERTGRNNRVFKLIKFRSMVKDAPTMGSWRTEISDVRITRIGTFLRKTSLDELPQFWNVLKGDMSLIGPRPNTPAQESIYSPQAWQGRHRVRPGITGLAQVNGRSDIQLGQQIAYDLAYAAKPTFAMDMRIVVKTLGVVLRKLGTN